MVVGVCSGAYGVCVVCAWQRVVCVRVCVCAGCGVGERGKVHAAQQRECRACGTEAQERMSMLVMLEVLFSSTIVDTDS